MVSIIINFHNQVCCLSSLDLQDKTLLDLWVNIQVLILVKISIYWRNKIKIINKICTLKVFMVMVDLMITQTNIDSLIWVRLDKQFRQDTIFHLNQICSVIKIEWIINIDSLIIILTKTLKTNTWLQIKLMPNSKNPMKTKVLRQIYSLKILCLIYQETSLRDWIKRPRHVISCRYTFTATKI